MIMYNSKIEKGDGSNGRCINTITVLLYEWEEILMKKFIAAVLLIMMLGAITVNALAGVSIRAKCNQCQIVNSTMATCPGNAQNTSNHTYHDDVAGRCHYYTLNKNIKWVCSKCSYVNQVYDYHGHVKIHDLCQLGSVLICPI